MGFRMSLNQIQKRLDLSTPGRGLFEITSDVQSWVQASQMFDIGGIEAEAVPAAEEKSREEGFKAFLSDGGWGEKAKNDTRKE